ncbi:hypothetical protein CRYUN_Cryun14cG0156800 [Craigia yunnanensis]
MKYSLCSPLGFLEILKKKSPQKQSSELPEDIYRQFSLAEIKAATNNFHQDSFIGEGIFSKVYRGTIDDGTMVAVKRCESRSFMSESRNEVQLLCQLRHPHLVSLIGICLEQNEMFIVFEYMRRGALNAFLFGMDSVSLAWKHRIQICICAARALHYLHTGAKYSVIHRGFKSTNILLDDECSCKLSGFGWSKMVPLSMSKPLIKMESRIVGSYGYMAPEYAFHGELTEKSDVYSFGIFLFEVLSGKKAYDATLPSIGLLYWATKLIREGTISHIIDANLKGTIAPDCFKKYLEIACSCVHDNRNERPDMGEVEVTLELALELQEKADSEMEGINHYAECMYEEAKFCDSVSNFGLTRDYSGDGYSSEQDSNFL